MKYIIVFFCSILLSIFSLKKNTPKLCINCKFFINDPIIGNKFGKCSLFPTDRSDTNFLITGITNIDYYYCSTTRQSENMCGKEGNKYKNKPNKKRVEIKK
jgi:hypothetical protein